MFNLTTPARCKNNYISYIIMSWLLGGVAYDVCKWTVKKGIEGWKEA